MKPIPQMEPWFDSKEANAVSSYMKSGGWVMEFNKTTELETKLAEFTGSKYAVMITNGTISLTLALLAFGLKPGDEVIVPDFTMIASPNAAVLVGIKPILVDIDPTTACLDLAAAQKAITNKTKALMYVPINGRSGDMDRVVKFCKRNKLFLLEDAAQALGSYWNSKHLGTFGDIGSFSFSAPKVISTGQGGAIVTNNEKLYLKIKKLKDFGRIKGGVDLHDDWGWNFKFTDIQAVIGLEQMKKLNSRLARKKQIYQQYVDGLSKIKQITFLPTNLKDTSPWFIDIYVKDPDQLAKYLKENGIGTRKVYPAIHSQVIFQSKYRHKKFPVAQHIADTGLWLPSSSKLTNTEINLVIKHINKYYT